MRQMLALGVSGALVLLAAAHGRAQTAICATPFQAFVNEPFNPEPPDPHLAVGRNHLVVIDHGRLGIYSKCGDLLAPMEPLDGADGFWGAPIDVIDPEAHYDPHTGRFFICAQSGIFPPLAYFLAFTDSSDPLGTWWKHRIDVPPELFAETVDSGNLAIDDESIWFSAIIQGGGFCDFVARIPKQALLSDPSVLPAIQWLGIPTCATGLPANFSYDDNPQYMINPSYASGSQTAVFLYAVRQTPSGGLEQVAADPIAVPAYQASTVSPDQPPPSGKLHIGPPGDSSRFFSCVYRDGFVWAIHHVENPLSPGRVIERWYQFDMNGWKGDPNDPQPFLADWGEIDPGPGLHAFHGSIGVDGNGNVCITYNRSGSTEFVSIRYVTWCAGNFANATHGIIRANTESFGQPGQLLAWGDYSATCPDPAVPNRFYSHNHFRQTPVETWIARIDGFCGLDFTGDGAYDAVDAMAFDFFFQAAEPEAELHLDGQHDANDWTAFGDMAQPK